MFEILKSLLEEDSSNIIYHVSIVKFNPRNNSDEGYDELYDAVENYPDPADDPDASNEEYELLRRTLRVFERGGGNVSNKNSNQIYVTSQPEAWMAEQVDELGITYRFGGIYALKLKHPVEEHLVNAGMGARFPEAIVNVDDIIEWKGPYDSKSQADKAFR